MNLQQRIEVERQITAALCQSILDNGFVLEVDNGDYSTNCNNAESALEAAFATDESWIYAREGNLGWAFGSPVDELNIVATFFMVYGNDGYDCLADHSVNDHTTKILETVEQLIEQLEELYA